MRRNTHEQCAAFQNRVIYLPSVRDVPGRDRAEINKTLKEKFADGNHGGENYITYFSLEQNTDISMEMAK